MDHPERYFGKNLVMQAMVMKPENFPKGYFVPGRMAMTCCADDMAFLGYACEYKGAEELHDKQWVVVTATLTKEFFEDYKGEGPVLHAIPILLFAVFAAVCFRFFICEEEDVRQSLLDRSDAAGIVTADNVTYFFRKGENSFFNDLAVFYYIDRNVVIYECEDIKIEFVDIAFYFKDIFFTHYLTAGILDDCNGAVHFVEPEMFIDIHTFSCFDMVKHKAFFYFSYIKHFNSP